MNNSASQKRPRIRKAPKLYVSLRREILERDGWRCQKCGCSKNLDVHHLRRRSSLGDDAATNLITLCRECHQFLHRFAGRLADRPCQRRPPDCRSSEIGASPHGEGDGYTRRRSAAVVPQISSSLRVVHRSKRVPSPELNRAPGEGNLSQENVKRQGNGSTPRGITPPKAARIC